MESSINANTNQKTSFSSTINPLVDIFTQRDLATANVWEDLQYQNQSEVIVAGETTGPELLKLFARYLLNQFLFFRR